MCEQVMVSERTPYDTIFFLQSTTFQMSASFSKLSFQMTANRHGPYRRKQQLWLLRFSLVIVGF